MGSVATMNMGRNNPPTQGVTSLRDQFAMAAMRGLLSSGEQMSWKELARRSYHAADTMLEERENPKEQND